MYLKARNYSLYRPDLQSIGDGRLNQNSFFSSTTYTHTAARLAYRLSALSISDRVQRDGNGTELSNPFAAGNHPTNPPPPPAPRIR